MQLPLAHQPLPTQHNFWDSNEYSRFLFAATVQEVVVDSHQCHTLPQKIRTVEENFLPREFAQLRVIVKEGGDPGLQAIEEREGVAVQLQIHRGRCNLLGNVLVHVLKRATLYLSKEVRMRKFRVTNF